MKANLELYIDGDTVEVTATRPGKQKPLVIYSGVGLNAIGVAQTVLVNELQQIRIAITEAARDAAVKAAQKEAQKAQAARDAAIKAAKKKK